MTDESRDLIDVHPGIAHRICESGQAAGGLPNQRPPTGHRAAVPALRMVDAASVESAGCSTGSRRADYFTPAKLEALVAVAEQGSLSAGARSLHIRQTALSQMIGGLERRLGTKLFVRT